MIAVDTMRATVFHAPEEFHVEEVDRPRPGAGEALIRVTLTTICGTDVHIVKGEYPVRPGLTSVTSPLASSRSWAPAYRPAKPLEEFALDMLLRVFGEDRYNRTVADYDELSALISDLKEAAFSRQ